MSSSSHMCLVVKLSEVFSRFGGGESPCDCLARLLPYLNAYPSFTFALASTVQGESIATARLGCAVCIPPAFSDGSYEYICGNQPALRLRAPGAKRRSLLTAVAPLACGKGRAAVCPLPFAPATVQRACHAGYACRLHGAGATGY